MDKNKIKNLIASFESKQSRTAVIVDFGNVDKWKESLGWKVGIQELAQLVKHFSKGNRELRRFYYGMDYGPNEKNQTPSMWSFQIIKRAEGNGFCVVDKRVKYIHNTNNPNGYDKKCDLDVEMAVDLIKMRDLFDNIILFSGDGDLMYATEYLNKEFGKKVYIFGARGHIGREVMDSVTSNHTEQIFHVEDFEYRLNMDRFRKR